MSQIVQTGKQNTTKEKRKVNVSSINFLAETFQQEKFSEQNQCLRLVTLVQDLYGRELRNQKSDLITSTGKSCFYKLMVLKYLTGIN